MAANTGFRCTQLGLGLAEIIIGVLCIVFQAIQKGVTDTFISFGPGFAVGTMALIVGSVGVIASRKKSRPVDIAFLVLNIVAAVISFVLCMITAILVVVRNLVTDSGCRSDGDEQKCMIQRNGFGGFMCILILAEVILNIIASGLSCGGVCRCCPCFLEDGQAEVGPMPVHYAISRCPQYDVMLANEAENSKPGGGS